MTTPNQLILVPPGIANFRAGIHRVVAASERHGQFVALFWLGEADKEKTAGIHKHCKKPRVHSWRAVTQHLQSHMFQHVPEISTDTSKPPNRHRDSALERKSYQRNKEILTSLVEPETLVAMLCLGQWKTRIDEAATQHKVNATTVIRLLARYFTLKMDIELASEDRYWCKGVRRKVTRKLGRPVDRYKTGHRLSAEGRNVTETDKTCIKAHYESLANQTVAKSEMYNSFLLNFGPKKIITNPTGGMEIQADASIPAISERQFRYHLSQIVGELKLLQTEAGERRINLSHRPALGSARDRIPYPGHTYIVDATVADVYLISAFDRRRLIGRPVIYLVVDAFSSLIVGVHVALEGPNLDQARIAMCRALSDKGRWLSWLGVSELAHLLPQGCVPTFWLADRGELHSKGSRGIQLELRTNLSIAGSYRADWKALVERTFGVLNTEFIHWIPGAVTERIRERGTRDTRLDAVLTIKEFTRLLVRRIAILNLTKDMSSHLSSAFITRAVVPNPLGFWSDGITNKHGSAVFLDHETALRKTLTHKETKLTRTGIMDDKWEYAAPWMNDHPLVKLAGFGDQSSVKLITSPDDPSAAWCLLPEETCMREVRFKRPLADANLFCIEDFHEVNEVKRFVGEDMVDDTKAESLDIQRQNANEIKEAMAVTKAANQAQPLSKRSKGHGIKANRQAEGERLEATNSTQQPHSEAHETLPAKSTPIEVGSSVSGTDAYFARLAEQLDSWGTP